MAARRLPVLQEPADPQRPRWQWVAIGAGMSFTSWLPLAVLASWIGRRLSGSGSFLALVVPSASSFVLACVIGGALITQFGSGIRVKHAALSGALAASGTSLLALLAGALRPWPIALIALFALAVLGTGASALGAGLVALCARRRMKQGASRDAKT